jgi:hypothetical protein
LSLILNSSKIDTCVIGDGRTPTKDRSPSWFVIASNFSWFLLTIDVAFRRG